MDACVSKNGSSVLEVPPPNCRSVATPKPYKRSFSTKLDRSSQTVSNALLQVRRFESAHLRIVQPPNFGRVHPRRDPKTSQVSIEHSSNTPLEKVDEKDIKKKIPFFNHHQRLLNTVLPSHLDLCHNFNCNHSSWVP